MELRNVPLTALLTLLVVIAVKWVRRRLGESNISHKTLISKHWLL